MLSPQSLDMHDVERRRSKVGWTPATNENDSCLLVEDLSKAG